MFHNPSPDVNYQLTVKKKHSVLLRIIDRLNALVKAKIINQQALINKEEEGSVQPAETLQDQLESWGEGEFEAATAFRDAYIIVLQKTLQNQPLPRGLNFFSLYSAYLQTLSALSPETAREKELGFINRLRDFLYTILMKQSENDPLWYQYRELGDLMADKMTEVWPRNEHQNDIPTDPIELTPVNDTHKINTAIGVQYNSASMADYRDRFQDQNNFNDLKTIKPFAKYDLDKIKNTHINPAEDSFTPILFIFPGIGTGSVLGAKLLLAILPLIVTPPVSAAAVPLYMLGCCTFIGVAGAIGGYLMYKAGEWFVRYRTQQRLKTLLTLAEQEPPIIAPTPALAQIQRRLSSEEKKAEPEPTAHPVIPLAPASTPAPAAPSSVTCFSMFSRIFSICFPRREQPAPHQSPQPR